MRHTLRLAVGVLVCAAAAASFEELGGVFHGSLDHPSIQYGAKPSHDAVAELNRRLDAGEVQLKFEGQSGYLKSVLAALKIPVESQIVAFAKTSVQSPRINPSNPRSLFFNDSTVVGWVRGGFIEAAAQDPEGGVLFYTLPQFEMEKPQFVKGRGCLSCHVSYATLGVPGMLLRSVFPAADGSAQYQAGSYVTDHRSPFEQRYGGWYVTGSSGPNRHLGNGILTNVEEPESMAGNARLNSLAEKFDTAGYLSPYSDVVALTVFEHQMRMMNLLTRVGWEARYGAYESRNGGTAQPLQVGELVDYMLFVDEAKWAGKIAGSSGFAEQFSAAGPLRQLDLEKRLLRVPCSYMIYSPAFEALPAEAKAAIYQRMWRILSGAEHDPKYARLTTQDRAAVARILRETKTDLPEYWAASR